MADIDELAFVPVYAGIESFISRNTNTS